MLRKRAIGIVALAVLVVAVIGIAACSSREPATNASIGTPTAMTPVQRGEYLATITGCNDCHTPGSLYGAPDFKRALAGSEVGWQGPWGVSYPTNLTPDMDTGIGSYTDAEIERVLRSGVKKNGAPIAGPMPWPSYARLTPEDMAALIAYLRGIPAVSHKNLSPLPPGHPVTGSVIAMPGPPAWDAPRGPAASPAAQ